MQANIICKRTTYTYNNMVLFWLAFRLLLCSWHTATNMYSLCVANVTKLYFNGPFINLLSSTMKFFFSLILLCRLKIRRIRLTMCGAPGFVNNSRTIFAEMPFTLQFKREVWYIGTICAIEQKQRRTRRATRLKSIKSIFWNQLPVWM